MKPNQIYLFTLITFLIAACSTDGEKKEGMFGEWEAKWETLESSYPDVKNVTSFTMDGSWTFNEDSTVTVKAFGFEGCIFGEDTISHTQRWQLTDNKLNLLNDGNTPGMSYTVLSNEENKIKLQLMSDIFIYLEK